MAKGGNAKGGFGSGSKKMGGGGMKPSRPPAGPRINNGNPSARMPTPRPPTTPPDTVGSLAPPPGPSQGPLPSPGGAFAQGGPVRRPRWMGGGK